MLDETEGSLFVIEITHHMAAAVLIFSNVNTWHVKREGFVEISFRQLGLYLDNTVDLARFHQLQKVKFNLLITVRLTKKHDIAFVACHGLNTGDNILT